MDQYFIARLLRADRSTIAGAGYRAKFFSKALPGYLMLPAPLTKLFEFEMFANFAQSSILSCAAEGA